jgi:hypothetical protein
MGEPFPPRDMIGIVLNYYKFPPVSNHACSFGPSLILFISDCFKKSSQNAAMLRFFALSEIKIIATYPKSHA